MVSRVCSNHQLSTNLSTFKPWQFNFWDFSGIVVKDQTMGGVLGGFVYWVWTCSSWSSRRERNGCAQQLVLWALRLCRAYWSCLMASAMSTQDFVEPIGCAHWLLLAPRPCSKARAICTFVLRTKLGIFQKRLVEKKKMQIFLDIKSWLDAVFYSFILMNTAEKQLLFQRKWLVYCCVTTRPYSTQPLHIEDTDGTLQFGNMNKENNTAAQ